ncbi:hypothetical protein OG921_25590 [Aldersonia sp. NBC_00410]|uniref:hypothetical protein n=1 Tax=Aldersonia sp. NBC_00410 TaxID=2975954 RepID=UPI0022594CF3|nr:hypothetical protein [Aldersonia sp. NBC_00410]MCX5046549.1 hypothetical protein [Aldersonia sp. NBC_00410]
MLTATHAIRISRRSSLRLLTGAVAIAVVGGATACAANDSGDDAPEVDPLIAAADRARADAAAAIAAIAIAPERGPALQTVADERTAHATALQDEITRAAGHYEDGSTPSTTASATSTGTPATPPPTIDELRARLIRSQQDAADLARTQSDYRAGLLGSISAACATYAGIVLA